MCPGAMTHDRCSARDNTGMRSQRWRVVVLVAVACIAGCASRWTDSPSPTGAPPLTAVATTTTVATTATPSSAGVPPLSPQAVAAGFVDIREVVPDSIVDLRYATPNNFVGTPMYPPDARCLVHES